MSRIELVFERCWVHIYSAQPGGELFNYTDHELDDKALSSAGAGVAEAAREARRMARRGESRMVLSAWRIYETTYREQLQGTFSPSPNSVDHVDADRMATGEVSLQLEVTKSKGNTWTQLGYNLRDLREVRLAYLAGDLATSRVVLIGNALGLLEEDTRQSAQASALALAARPTTDGTLRHQLDRLIIEIDPDAAERARNDFRERYQDVKIRDEAHGHSSVDALVPAEFGLFLKNKIAALIDERICKGDPRRVGERRVVAVQELSGMPGLELRCHCGRTDCSGVPAEEIQEGAGAEAVTPEATETDDVDDNTADPVQTELIVVIDPTGVEVPSLRGYGSIDPAHLTELAAGLAVDVAAVQIIERPDVTTVIGDPRRPAPPIDPTGHGGLKTPPRGALIYRPSRRLREQILATDDACRYPYCGKPAADCELDHVVKFDHADPQAGGWTVFMNLAPLCSPDHHRKHGGMWIPTMNVDRSITWRNPETGQIHITHPR